jgi:NADPH2:quinone reductase
MRAMQVLSLGGPEALVIADIASPDSGDGAVLIDVHSAGVSFPDLLLTKGQYQQRPALPFVPGVEVAGTVRQAPSGCGLSPGDRVASFVRLGGWAEIVAARPEFVFLLPEALSYRSGAGIVMNYLTAHLAVVRRGRVLPGDVVLVHGAAGGLGTASLQLAKAMGARTIGVVSTPLKAEAARAAGADNVVLLDGWLERTREVTGGRGVDVVIDPVGG